MASFSTWCVTVTYGEFDSDCEFVLGRKLLSYGFIQHVVRDRHIRRI